MGIFSRGQNKEAAEQYQADTFEKFIRQEYPDLKHASIPETGAPWPPRPRLDLTDEDRERFIDGLRGAMGEIELYFPATAIIMGEIALRSDHD